MNNWKQITFSTRKDVFLEKVCDEYLLIAVKEAANHCHHIQSINDMAAYYWEKLSQKNDLDLIIEESSNEFGVEKELVQKDLFNLLDLFESGNYLVIKS